MAQTKSLGELIKEARTSAGLTQEQLAQSVDDMTASDISKAERGQKVPTQNQLKQIAKTTGVTQKSLLDAAKAQAVSDNEGVHGIGLGQVGIGLFEAPDLLRIEDIELRIGFDHGRLLFQEVKHGETVDGGGFDAHHEHGIAPGFQHT